VQVASQKEEEEEEEEEEAQVHFFKLWARDIKNTRVEKDTFASSPFSNAMVRVPSR
jgi:hypothetical protein